ncbi:hypothetical protein ACI2KR_27390 [Pseudomonas luteola]
MERKPVIDPDEPVVMISCAKCQGTIESFIYRFASKAELARLTESQKHGFVINKTKMSEMGDYKYSCKCRRQQV